MYAKWFMKPVPHEDSALISAEHALPKLSQSYTTPLLSEWLTACVPGTVCRLSSSHAPNVQGHRGPMLIT